MRAAKEINGFFLEDKKVENPTKKGDFKEYKKGDPVPTFAWLQDDGSTSPAAGYTAAPTGRPTWLPGAARKMPPGIGLYSDWAWSWPVNRRIIYNGASVDPTGQTLGSQAGRHQMERRRNGSAM